ncbi:MAG: zf-HC2 domain-containing protein [Bryobacteraceae bacterium]
MKCLELKDLVALHVSGDLAEGEAARVEEHVRDCEACRGLAAELAADRAALVGPVSGHLDPDLDAAAARVRTRVLARVAAQSGRTWWYAAAAMLIAALGLAALWRIERPDAPIVAGRAPAAEKRAPEPPAAEVKAPAAVVKKAAMPARPKRRPVRNTEPMLVKMLTDTDDIVIYWIVESKGDLE